MCSPFQQETNDMSRRIRKHANPFNVTTEVGVLDRLAVFGRQAPLEVDIGCGGGSYLLQRAKNNPDTDFVGFEVRKPLVEAAMQKRETLGLKNLVIYYANAHTNLPQLVAPGIVKLFTIMFPDPSFKKRHWKRRILQPTLVRTMAELLPIGGKIFAQSDVKPLAEEMYEFFSAETAVASRLDPIMTVDSPVPERTEWERHHEENKEPIYRMVFEKTQEPSGEIPPWEMRDCNPMRQADGSAE